MQLADAHICTYVMGKGSTWDIVRDNAVMKLL